LPHIGFRLEAHGERQHFDVLSRLALRQSPQRVEPLARMPSLGMVLGPGL
jgi:hypothetical protein